MNKKLLSVILSSAIVAGALVGCSGKSVSSDSKKMTVGALESVNTMQPFFYDEFSDESENLEVNTFEGYDEIKDAVISGKLDIAATNWISAIKAAEKGEDIKVIAGMSNGGSALVVKKDSGIENIEDLKGKTIGYFPESIEYVKLANELKEKGIDIKKDVKFKEMDFESMTKELSGGNIDAFCGEEPYVSIALEDGFGKVIDYKSDEIVPLNTAIIATEENIKDNPEKMRELMDKHVKSTNHLMMIKEDRINKAAEFGIDKKYLEKSIDNIELSTDISPEMIEEVKKLAEKMKEIGMIDNIPNIENMFDLSMLENSMMKR